MANPFAMNRMASIFGSAPSFADKQKKFLTGSIQEPELDTSWQEQEQEPPPQDEGSRYFDEMQKVRGNRGPALSAYQKALGEMPTMEGSKPGIGRRIAATIGGIAGGLGGGPAAGVGVANQINQAPYQNAVSEYSMKMRGLGESAKLEQDETESQLKALSEARALGLKYDDYRLKQLESERDFKIESGNLAVSERGAATGETNAATQRNRSINEGRNIDSQITNRGAMTGVAQTNAQTGQTNARTGQTNAATGQTNAATAQANQVSLDSYRKAQAALGGKRLINQQNGQAATPAEQTKAVDLALRLMKSEPKWANFINHDAKGSEIEGKADEPYIVSPNDGTFEYAEFQRELARRAQMSFVAHDPFGASDDNEFEIGEPQ